MKIHSCSFGHVVPVSRFPRACSPVKGLGLALIASAVLAVQAGAVVLSLGESNNPTPSGIAPWVTATFADFGDDTVRLTIDPSGLFSLVNPHEALTEMTFNLRPDFANPLIFTFVDPAAPKTKQFSVSYAKDSKTISGGGNTGTMGAFDILVNLPPPGDFVTYEDRVVIDIFGEGLKASDFAYATDKGYFTAGKIQRLLNDASTQIFSTVGPDPVIIPVPEPGSIAPVVALISCGLLLRSRRTPAA